MVNDHCMKTNHESGYLYSKQKRKKLEHSKLEINEFLKHLQTSNYDFIYDFWMPTMAHQQALRERWGTEVTQSIPKVIPKPLKALKAEHGTSAQISSFSNNNGNGKWVLFNMNALTLQGLHVWRGMDLTVCKPRLLTVNKKAFCVQFFGLHLVSPIKLRMSRLWNRDGQASHSADSIPLTSSEIQCNLGRTNTWMASKCDPIFGNKFQSTRLALAKSPPCHLQNEPWQHQHETGTSNIYTYPSSIHPVPFAEPRFYPGCCTTMIHPDGDGIPHTLHVVTKMTTENLEMTGDDFNERILYAWFLMAFFAKWKIRLIQWFCQKGTI